MLLNLSIANSQLRKINFAIVVIKLKFKELSNSNDLER